MSTAVRRRLTSSRRCSYPDTSTEDSNLPRYRRSPRYLRARVGVFPAKDVVVWTPAEVDAWRDVPHAFITTALREGRTLYER